MVDIDKNTVPKKEHFFGKAGTAEICCGTCKFMNQSNGCASCFNPDQKDNRFKHYVYHTFICEQYTPGPQETEDELLARGYIKRFQPLDYADGSTGGYHYFVKKETPEIKKLHGN